MSGSRHLAALAVGLVMTTSCTPDPTAADGAPRAAPAAPPTATSAAPVVAACPDLPRVAPVPGGLPDLTLPCLGEGPDVRLSDLRGVPTVVNVWAAWCTNCEREMPLFASAVEQYGERVRFFGVHYKATRDQGLSAQDDFGVPFASAHDQDGDRVVATLRATAPPQTFFVDAAGRVTGREIGEITSRRELRELIERHLGVGS